MVPSLPAPPSLPLSSLTLLASRPSDLFAFVIKMPLMHRLACFRDDIIFFIYLYQRWVYAVDMSRVNEFGQGGEDQPEPSSETETTSAPESSGESKTTEVNEQASPEQS
jgi:hypothetical protein